MGRFGRDRDRVRDRDWLRSHPGSTQIGYLAGPATDESPPGADEVAGAAQEAPTPAHGQVTPTGASPAGEEAPAVAIAATADAGSPDATAPPGSATPSTAGQIDDLLTGLSELTAVTREVGDVAAATESLRRETAASFAALATETAASFAELATTIAAGQDRTQQAVADIVVRSQVATSASIDEVPAALALQLREELVAIKAAWTAAVADLTARFDDLRARHEDQAASLAALHEAIEEVRRRL